MALSVLWIGTGRLSAQTADAVLKKTAAAIKGADGLSASFTLTSGSQKIAGSMKSASGKFSLVTSTISTWYDGKTMWTYNSKTKETTVMTPTQAELAEANPLYVVNSYSGNFTADFAKTQPKGAKTIVLTPKSKKLGYKSVHVTVSDGTGLPSQVVVLPLSGQKITINVSQIKTGQKLQPSVFTYPKSKYPGAEIVDLR